MKTFVGSLLGLSLLTFSTAAHAEAPKCHKDAAKLEWFVCGVKDVEYKRGIKTETRSECGVNVKLKTVSACDLGDLVSQLPADIDPSNVFFYALGPKELDATVGFEAQHQADKPACRMGKDYPEYWQLGKFSDAFDKSNAERSELVKEKLAADGKHIVGGVILGNFRDMGCQGTKATIGVIDTATFSQLLWFSETTFK